ncbi:MAG: hypothetical protein K6B44_02530 [Lachnospiraceae bacterium]|nr:hypothetical protein [Lachnospiraceae bacterium]
MSTGYEETGNMEVPALLVIWAFELFRDVAENVAGSACYVKMAVYEARTERA